MAEVGCQLGGAQGSRALVGGGASPGSEARRELRPQGSVLQAAWPSGTECIAKYNFHGTAEQDLPFCKGDVLTIVAVTKVIRECMHAPHPLPPLGVPPGSL